ncbi:hypothetical protein O7635_34230 [Asanoa sp. WMMD1127]|uniref:hypothetical protein n=1 Tax=Asanoa sp. WMMD1127 TaxID=3016107 RepID=UPI002415AEEB|nr:hypothetical protein [Asanoa sp. WMMD1127]MDG4826931.1 hypothetical protein [Asanoa sp. WMMD1127]
MIAVCGTAVLVGFVSAVLPLTPVEPYVVAAVAATDESALIVGIAAAAGQTAGKLLLFLTARGALRSTCLRRRLPKPAARRPPRRTRRRAAAALRRLDQPRQAVPILFASAVTGLPPLLATSVYAARTTMSGTAFSVTCLAGRAIRLSALASAPHLLGILH